MRIVVAPDKFKGSLGAADVARAVAAGVKAALPAAVVDTCPMSDGGEGFVAALVGAMNGRLITQRVTGPLPEMKVDATFGVVEQDPKLAVIEMSAASGLHLLRPDEYLPHATTTFGTGELLAAAAEMGCRRILLGIGGSATIDGGIGCCQAAGLSVLLDGGEPTSLTEPLCGRDLPRVVHIKSHRGEALAGVEMIVASDVTNPLCGPNGAAAVFGPQKGATAEEVTQFDRWLRQLAVRTGTEAIADIPGAGAAGGLGFAAMAFFSASLVPGVDVVIEATHLRERLAGAMLCITGEGSLDDSSFSGKAPVGVALVCQKLGVPCLAIVGRHATRRPTPFADVVSLESRAGSAAGAISRAAELLESVTREWLERHQDAIKHDHR